MIARLAVAFILISSATVALAGGYARPVVMIGQTHMADTAELRFDSAPARTGKLVILGDHTKTPEQAIRFSYEIRALKNKDSAPTVDIVFADKKTLSILCDPYSENCRSLDYVTEAGSTFSMLWKISNWPTQGITLNSTTHTQGFASQP